MKTTELILLVCGATLFICSLAFMFLLFKKDKPMTKMIWFLVLSFIMMGFSVISEANIVGLVEYKKEKLSEVAFLTEALEKCPENETIKEELAAKIDKYVENEEIPDKPEEIKQIGKTYLTLGDEQKVISYSDKILAKDTANQVAKDLKKFAETQQFIKKMPTNNTERRNLARKISNNIKELEESPTVEKEQVIQLKNMYRKTVLDIKKSESQ